VSMRLVLTIDVVQGRKFELHKSCLDGKRGGMYTISDDGVTIKSEEFK